MRSRAVILPYPGDPFLLNYWLQNFYQYWEPEIDKLYVILNSPVENKVVEYIRYLCADSSDKIVFIYENKQIEHGDVIRIGLETATEEFVMLIEDDGFIFKKGVVDFCFRQIEDGNFDIVGSKRGSCSMEILKAAEWKWGLNYRGYGDQGCNFWPCYFFSKRQLLLDTDRNFSARAWKTGETIEPLSYVVEVPVINGDTFVNTSLQLQNKIPQSRILYVPQYHGSPDDLEHYDKHKDLFDGLANWTHVGSLSSGIGGLLKDDVNRCLARRLIDPPGEPTQLNLDWCQTDQERHEFERRVQWWLTFYEHRQLDEIEEFAELYRAAIFRIIDQYKLDIHAIRHRQKAYRTLGL